MTTVISMWSGPRNISTTMMRSFGNRADTRALDEPFYACYLAQTGAEHPYRTETLAAYPNEFQSVIRWIDGEKSHPTLFLKHIAYHLAEDQGFGFLEGWRNFLLIRDPRAMVASFSNKYEDVTPIIRSYEIELRIFEHLNARGLPCPIVDAADMLTAPEAMLTSLCAALGVSFDPAMLAWKAGPRPEDGPWAPHWYDAVWSSDGFRPYVEKSLTLNSDLELAAAGAADAYARLHAARLTI
ncbi:MAG: HAD family hydrolase [Parvularculaceae bacterium]